MSLSRRLFVACLLIACMPFVAAADKKPEAVKPPPPDLDGRTYSVTYPTEDKKPKDKIIFADGKVTIQTLKEVEITYKAKVKANRKGVVSETEFEGKAKMPDGVIYEIDGAVSLSGEIRGSIIRREKDMDPTARNFNGKQSAGKR